MARNRNTHVRQGGQYSAVTLTKISRIFCKTRSVEATGENWCRKKPRRVWFEEVTVLVHM